MASFECIHVYSHFTFWKVEIWNLRFQRTTTIHDGRLSIKPVQKAQEREKEVFSHARRKDQTSALATQSRGWRKIKDWLLHSMLKRLGLAAALVLCLQARLIIFRHPLGIVGLAIGIPRPPVSCLHSPSSYLVCICNLPGSTLREPHFASSKKAASAKSLALFLSKNGNFYWELDSLLLVTIRGSVF